MEPAYIEYKYIFFLHEDIDKIQIRVDLSPVLFHGY